MLMEERVLVKHAVTGRMLLNSSQDQITYSFAPSGAGSLISICGVSRKQAESILELKQELNVFRFEKPQGGKVTKHWFYVKDGRVSYDEAEQCLTIEADSGLTYQPDDYWS